MLPLRLYTAGIADFESVRQDGRIYVDKTDLIYRLTHESKFVFLSSPRRFGKLMQAFFASIPYLEFGGKELDDITKYEAYYEVLTYVVFSIFNCRTFTQVKVARGRTDVVVFMHDAVYVMELKMHGTADEALQQIDSKDYAIPYQAEGKPVIKIGIAFSQETKTVSDWKVVNA